MRHVQQHEIPKLLQAIQNYPTELGRYALMLLALNYCRPSELIKAQWHEIDLEFGLWTLESERMKKKKAFIRPLARQSIHILQQLKRITGDSPYLFPSRLDRNKPMTIGFLQMALNRLKVNQTPHGFRHIANTYLTENASKHKIHYEVIEFSLAHAVKGIRGVYNKAQYLDDRKILAQWYADQLYSMIE